MNSITIVAKSIKGSKELRRAFNEAKDAPKMQRKIYDMLYQEAIISEKPFSIKIESRTGISDSMLSSIFDENLKTLKLVKGKDYSVMLYE